MLGVQVGLCVAELISTIMLLPCMCSWLLQVLCTNAGHPVMLGVQVGLCVAELISAIMLLPCTCGCCRSSSMPHTTDIDCEVSPMASYAGEVSETGHTYTHTISVDNKGRMRIHYTASSESRTWFGYDSLCSMCGCLVHEVCLAALVNCPISFFCFY